MCFQNRDELASAVQPYAANNTAHASIAQIYDWMANWQLEHGVSIVRWILAMCFTDAPGSLTKILVPEMLQ